MDLPVTVDTSREFAAAQAQFVTQDGEQRNAAVNADGDAAAVDDEIDAVAHARPIPETPIARP